MVSRERLSLRELALAAVAHRVDVPAEAGPEAAFLAEHRGLSTPPSLAEALAQTLRKPGRVDAGLASLAGAWNLNATEVLSAALAAAVEDDVMTGRAVAFAQAPLGGSRPTLGLLAVSFGRLTTPELGPGQLASGTAFTAGLLTLLHEGVPLPERPVAMPAPICLALADSEASWPFTIIGAPDEPRDWLPDPVRQQCRRQVAALSQTQAPVLVIRSAHAEETRAVATEIASELKFRAVFIEASAPLAGLGAWVRLRGLLPVFACDLAPGETRTIPSLPHYVGPVLVVAGIDGVVHAPGREAVSWVLPVPEPAERLRLWRRLLADDPAVAEMAASHRQSAARIAQLGRLALHQARLDHEAAPTVATVRRVARTGEGSGLDSLALPIAEVVNDDALVLTPETRAELQALLARCRQRDGLTAGLGPSAVARYTAGVRALFVGPSGTGKTLAACWLATTLGLPLYRVDLSAVTSKYIGETEKNLALLLARAESTEAVLLFDEADSLFGKRTDVRESNDRFANSQTNYLLQRIETFNGIAVLTSNSRTRFDAAFSRRLDLIIEFPLPGPAERRALWLAHLGDQHALTSQDLNLLAGQCDFPGGQIRNVVLAAAVEARERSGPIDLAGILRALAGEFRKAGRSLPATLTTTARPLTRA